jgi:hypothetical protein
MANTIMPKWKEALAQGTAGSALTGTLKASLVDTGVYTFSAAHEFYSSLTGVAGTPQTIGSKTYVGGLLDGADVTFPAVGAGNSLEAIYLWLDTGTPSTSRLVAFMDTGVTGLPVTPNGGDIVVTWNVAGIIQL